MMYVAQFGAVLFVTWASIHYEWTPNPYATGVVALLAALLVTAIIMEIQLLPTRLARLYRRIFRLNDEPASEIPRLARSRRHGNYPLEDRRRLRIGKDLR